MLTALKIYNQINSLTSDFIRTGLCDDQNYPHIKDLPNRIKEVTIDKVDTSIFLKNIPYDEMYQISIEKRAYNLRMIDGALILLQYRFQHKVLIAHRLTFFPSPNLFEFQNEPEVYMEDDIYADVLDNRVVTVPLRFDYDNRAEVARPIEHPISHLTVGQYKNCRIPVTSAITPYFFLSFVLRNFYHTATQKDDYKLSSFKEYFNKEIFNEELREIHMYSPCGDCD